MDITPASLAFGLIAGSAGLATLQIGRRRSEVRKIACGVALMGLTFVVGSTWWSWLLALVVLGAAYYP
ncbi:MAG: hypothetical protein FJ102_17355 [Deltaproteobacteria bacterium]|nr:hypothetical protein [Deltaproteobacteria bacterium]